MNTKLFLLIGTSLSFLPALSLAQCVETTNCETLGYTETSCNGGKGVNGPFGNKCACLGANEDEFRDKVCQELGFAYTCTGTGHAGGAGSACGGKYTQCTCSSGYEWKNGSCLQISDGAHGDLYYCNGAVVAVKAPGMNFYVAMKDLGYMNLNSADQQCSNYTFCGSAKGTLPSSFQLQTMSSNKSTLDNLLSTNNGTPLTNGYYWSFTKDYIRDSYYTVNMSSGFVDETNTGNGDSYVRPVLTSW